MRCVGRGVRQRRWFGRSRMGAPPSMQRSFFKVLSVYQPVGPRLRPRKCRHLTGCVVKTWSSTAHSNVLNASFTQTGTHSRRCSPPRVGCRASDMRCVAQSAPAR
eukprot:6985479-Prymnesium_polylepis.1